MALTGKQKAAMLLLSLDARTVTELLKSIEPGVVQELAMELANLDSSGNRDLDNEIKVAKEFYNSLEKGQTGSLSMKSFFNEMLVSLLGKEQAEQIHSQIKQATQKKDPFMEIRSANIDELVLALEGQHQQTIALVLSELSPEKSQKVLSHLNEDVRNKTVRKMTTLDVLGPEVRRRIAFMISDRIKEFKGEKLPEDREQTLRKLAIMLSGLEKNLSDRLLEEIGKDNEEVSIKVRQLMITWEDIPVIADRSLQEVLRNVDASKLAIALFGADEEIAQKIRSNISERAAESLDEEISLMQEPIEKEIQEAREEISKPLREANEAGTLRYTRK